MRHGIVDPCREMSCAVDYKIDKLTRPLTARLYEELA